VAERLPQLLRHRIENPVVSGQFLDDGWSSDERAEFVAQAETLLARLQDAIRGTDSTQHALASLVLAFGDRVPSDHTLIKPEASPGVAAPALLTSGLIKQMGNERAPREAVKREGDRRYG